MNPTKLVLIAAVIPFAISACSGSSKAVTTTTATPATTTTTTAPTTTSTVSSTTAPPTTTTGAPAPVWPLTGLPVNLTDIGNTGRPAIVAKISNDQCAWPQFGLSQADVITEAIVEGDITRFFVAFHSRDPGTIGPIRSGRGTDAQYVEMYTRPIFAWSGGNPSVQGIIRGTNVQDRGAESNASGYFRAGSRCNANTEFVKAADLWSQAEKDSKAPTAIFTYVDAGKKLPEGDGGLPVSKVEVQVGGYTIRYEYDKVTNSYNRFRRDGVVHEDEAGNAISPTTVIVAATPYAYASYEPKSPEANGVGSGDVWVFSGGAAIHGTWTRKSVSDRWHFTDPKGKEIKILPGQALVELTRSNSVKIVG